MYQTSFHNVINNNTSSVLREKVLLTNLVPKYGGKNICGKMGVQVDFKGNNTTRDLLVVPKDRDNIVNKGGVIYRYKCGHLRSTVE